MVDDRWKSDEWMEILMDDGMIDDGWDDGWVHVKMDDR